MILYANQLNALLYLIAAFQLRAVAAELKRISADFHIAVLLTNNVRYYGDVPQGCLGAFWASVPHLSLYMTPSKTVPIQQGLSVVEVRKGARFACRGEQPGPTTCAIDFRKTWDC